MTERKECTEDKNPAEQAADKPTVSAQSSGFNLGSVINDAKRIATDSAGFYSSMPQTGGFVEPCIFLVVMASVSGALVAILSMFGMGHLGAMAIGIGSILFFPVMALIGSFVGALVMFVIWKLMGSSKDYETSYRCIAYASVVYPVMPLVGWIPYLGTIVSLGLGMYLIFVATTQVHEIKQQTAQTVIGVLATLLLLVQLSGEYTARNFQAQMEDSARRWQKNTEEMGKAFENISKNTEEMTPEEAGKALGEFFKGFSESMPEELKQQVQEAQRRSAQSTPSAENGAAAPEQ